MPTPLPCAQRLEEAETQIRLLKNVVIQSLRAQSAAEEALRREQAAAPPSVAAPEAEPAPTDSAGSDARGAGRSAHRQRPAPAGRRGRAAQPRAERATAGDRTGNRLCGRRVRPDDPIDRRGEPLEEDAMLPEAGMGGRYEPWNEDEPAQSSRGAYAAVPSDEAMSAAGEPIKIAEVHFNSGSAQLTPGGERRTLDAIERIRSMAPATGAGGRVHRPGRRLGLQPGALQGARPRGRGGPGERAGLPRDMVEVVGSGEEGVPVPTPDGVPEPLNRSAGIFVVRDATG